MNSKVQQILCNNVAKTYFSTAFWVNICKLRFGNCFII
jgi:hypothetical protein